MTTPVFLLMSGQANAQTWDGSANSSYGNAANWDTNTVPGPGTTATFDDTGAAQSTVDLGGVTYAVDGWVFNGNTGYSMENGTVNFLTAAGLTHNSTGGTGISANITGIGSVTQNGTATLFLLGQQYL